MTLKVRPASPELREFYSARTAWRSKGEERMRFRKAAALARVPTGASVLDIGARDGGLKRFLPPGVVYQGIDIASRCSSMSRTRSGRSPSFTGC